MREKQQSLHSVLQILGCCHWILNNTIELFKKINKIGWKFDPLRFSMAFHFLIFFLKLNLLIQVVNKLFSTPSSTLGKLHVFGCACLKHKYTVIPTFWESPYLFNLKDCTFQTLDTSLKGLILFSSVEQVEVIVSNLMFGPALMLEYIASYFRTMDVWGYILIWMRQISHKVLFLPQYFLKP